MHHHHSYYIQNYVIRKSAVLRYGVLVPEEIIMQEILTRLPIKSLLRFRCVCKSWKSQLYNPDYLSLLNRSSSSDNNYDYLIFMYHYYDNRFPPGNLLYFLSSGVKQFWESRNFNNVLCKTRINNVPYPLSLSTDKDLHMVGSVNGLVCMAFYFEGEHQFILWNPTIRLSKTVLVPNDLGLRRTSSFDDDGDKEYYSRMVYGFGWDSKTDDYKLIIKPLNRVSPACVYSCKTDCWSNINNNTLSMVNSVVWHKCKPPCVIVNGFPYWSEWTDTNILKFDVTSNEFTSLNLPSAGCFIYGLINLNGRLALIDSVVSSQGSVLYSFDEENNIWVKMCIICMRLSQSSSPCFTYDGGIVFRDGYGFWYWYDLKSHKLKYGYEDFGMSGISLSNVFSYTLSLVALQGMNEQGIACV